MERRKDQPEYSVWRDMLARCRNPKRKNYHRYGGRGISVCERWLNYANFIADMGPRPSSKHSIDRYPNKDGNYEPGNCRWATQHEQMLNYCGNRLLTAFGETKPFVEWQRDERCKVSPKTLQRRINKNWDAERAMTFVRQPDPAPVARPEKRARFQTSGALSHEARAERRRVMADAVHGGDSIEQVAADFGVTCATVHRAVLESQEVVA